MTTAPESSTSAQQHRTDSVDPGVTFAGVDAGERVHDSSGHSARQDVGTGTGPDTVTDPGTGQDAQRDTTVPGVPEVLIRFGDRRRSRFLDGIRAPLPPLPPYATAPAPALPAPPSRRPSRRAVQITAAGLAVLVAVTAVVVIRNASGSSPRQLVQRLFDQLTDRDPNVLHTVGKCTTINQLCGTTALTSGYQPPTNMHIDRTNGEIDGAHGSKQTSITVSYDLDGHRVTTDITLEYRKQGLFTGYWSITEPPGRTLTFPGPTQRTITVANAHLPPIAADTPATVWAPPGVYTISQPGTALLEPSQLTITVDGTYTATTGDKQQPTTVTLPDTIKPAVSGQVHTDVKEHLDACAAQRVFAPDTDPTPGTPHTCPLQHSTRYAITDDPTWTILQYPQIHLEPMPDGSLTVTTTTAGRAAIHYRWTLYLREPRQWYDADAVEDIIISGKVTAEQGAPTWTPS